MREWLMLCAFAGLGLGASPVWAAEGYLGVGVQDADPLLRAALDLEDDPGVVVNMVEEDSPAELAGIEVGDLILAVDGQEVRDVTGLIDLIRDEEPGTGVEIALLQNGRRTARDVILAERDRPFERLLSTPGFFSGDLRLGMRLTDINPNLAKYFDTDRGALVLHVEGESAAEEAGMISGDVIVRVGEKDVHDAAGLRDLLAEQEERSVELEIVRRGVSRQITLELPRLRLPHVYKFKSKGQGAPLIWHRGSSDEDEQDGFFGQTWTLPESSDVEELREMLEELRTEIREGVQQSLEQMRAELMELKADLGERRSRRSRERREDKE